MAEAREGRPRLRPAGGGGAGGPRWVRKVGPPKPSSPQGWSGRPGEWPAGRSLTDPGGRHCPASGGCGRARAVARRAASNGPARAACILPGPAGRGGPFWAAPLSWAGSPRLGTEVPLERGAPDTGCREPSGAWLDVPAGPGGSLWGGAPSVARGGSSGAGPFGRDAQPGWPSPGVVRARGVAEARGGPGAASRSRGARGSRGSTGTAGARGRGVMQGTRGAQRSQGCAALQGARGGTSAAAGAAGSGVGSGAPGGPRAGLRGAAGGRAAVARAPPCCSAAGREGERRAGERRGAGPSGGLGPPGRGEGRTRRGGRGAGAAPGRAAGSRGELRARVRRGGV